MKFNINNYVKVKLNERGKEILKKEWDSRPNIFRSQFEFELPEEDEDGYSKWQLWNLMTTFGEYMWLGCVVPFETEIEIINE